MRRAFLGIDCGTQSTKALLLDDDTGAELATGRAEHQLISRPDGTREQEQRWCLPLGRPALADARWEPRPWSGVAVVAAARQKSSTQVPIPPSGGFPQEGPA